MAQPHASAVSRRCTPLAGHSGEGRMSDTRVCADPQRHERRPQRSRHVSSFVARHLWRRCGVSPRGVRAHGTKSRASLRGLLVPLATLVALRHTALH